VTAEEWIPVARKLRNCWRGDFSDEMAGDYFDMLASFPGEVVEGAVKALVLDPKPWVPAVPEIIGQIRKMVEPPVPAWPEVRNALLRALSVGAKRNYFASDEEKQVKAVRWLEEKIHPVVARFFEMETYERLARIEWDDPEYGMLREKELRERWEEFIDVARARMERGLALEAAGGGMQLGPRRLDAAASLLGVSERPQLEEGSSS
jgi:hypothetical protein